MLPTVMLARVRAVVAAVGVGGDGHGVQLLVDQGVDHAARDRLELVFAKLTHLLEILLMLLQDERLHHELLECRGYRVKQFKFSRPLPHRQAEGSSARPVDEREPSVRLCWPQGRAGAPGWQHEQSKPKKLPSDSYSLRPDQTR